MKRQGHICPRWAGYLQILPLRKWLHDPRKIVLPFVGEGMKVLEIGPGMGYFSLPIAKKIGPDGKLYAVDIQQKMISELGRRAGHTGVAEQIECRLSGNNALPIDDLKESVDFVFAFAVLHEIPYKQRLFEQVHAAMIPAGSMLLADPKAHCSESDFNSWISTAEKTGFILRPGPPVKGFHSSVLVRGC